MAAAMVPLPSASNILHGISRTFQLTPTTPMPLLPTAPMVPATWVPWAVVVHRIGVAVDGRDAVAVVDEAVAVVVDAVAVAVRLVAQHVGGEVLVGVVDPAVDDRHHDVRGCPS